MKILVVILTWIAVGVCMMGGMKLADWTLPDPPRKRLLIKLECDSEQEVAPAHRHQDAERNL